MSAALLETADLTKSYGGPQPALEALTLSVAPGEVFGLLGPNGSGKSTALRLLLGFLRPTRGRATVAGLDCWADSVEVRRRVAYLPGELRLYESMTGRQLVRFLARLRNRPDTADPDELARRLDIDIDRPLVQMSSGMKRKVALLTVLLPRVDLVILDEPTNTLDPVMRDELLGQLRQAKQRGQAVLFSSHVLSEVEQVCDRVGILQRGRLVHVQGMADVRVRRVFARFSQPPRDWPAGFGPPPTGLAATFEYEGPVQDLVGWLGRQALADVRIEPAGLSAVYQRFHGAADSE